MIRVVHRDFHVLPVDEKLAIRHVVLVDEGLATRHAHFDETRVLLVDGGRLATRHAHFDVLTRVLLVDEKLAIQHVHFDKIHVLLLDDDVERLATRHVLLVDDRPMIAFRHPATRHVHRDEIRVVLVDVEKLATLDVHRDEILALLVDEKLAIRHALPVDGKPMIAFDQVTLDVREFLRQIDGFLVEAFVLQIPQVEIQNEQLAREVPAQLQSNPLTLAFHYGSRPALLVHCVVTTRLHSLNVVRRPSVRHCE